MLIGFTVPVTSHPTHEPPKAASPGARGEAARAGTQNEKPVKARPEPRSGRERGCKPSVAEPLQRPDGRRPMGGACDEGLSERSERRRDPRSNLLQEPLAPPQRREPRFRRKAKPGRTSAPGPWRFLRPPPSSASLAGGSRRATVSPKGETWAYEHVSRASRS